MTASSYVRDFNKRAVKTAQALGGLQGDPQRPRNDQYDAYRHALMSAKLAERFDQDCAKGMMDWYEQEHPDDDPKETNMDLWNNNVGRTEYLNWKAAKDAGTTSDSLEKWIYDAVKNGKTINDLNDPRKWVEPANSSGHFDWKCVFPLIGIPLSSSAAPRRDPLILDLDGDGIETIGTDGRAFFDHGGDGFAESTGWVNSDDGLLVWDRNGDGIINDGKELFGDQTLLKNGTKAANGLQALAEYDDNQDGKIDAQDSIWANIKIWQDQGFEGPDGDSNTTDTSELHSLSDFNITAIYLNSTITNTSDGQGNTQTRLGSFEKADGTTGQMGEYVLQRNTTDAVYDLLPVPDDIAALPNLDARGNVYYLQQTMVRDTTGQLKALVQAFMAETNVDNRDSLLQQIVFKWTGADKVASNARGPYMDGRKVVALEKFYGQTLPNPDANLAVAWQQVYRNISEIYYSQLMAQSHLSDLYESITPGDLSAAITQLQTELAQNYDAGKVRLSEFARTLRGLGLQDTVNYLSFRETFLLQDPSLGWVIDSSGLPTDGDYYRHLNGAGHVWGYDTADAILRNPAIGDPYINGFSGNDVLYGTARNEVLINELGDSLLVAGAGDDILYGGAGNDTLDGGIGNDELRGEAGNDTYLFRRGSGQDTIVDSDATADNLDTLWLGSHLTPADVTVRRIGNHLVLYIRDTIDTLTVQDFYLNDSPVNRIERIQFQDGTVWTQADIQLQTQAGATDSPDVLYGGSGNDTIAARGGDDRVYALAGDDTLTGGTGNDTLDGGIGNDTYIFNRGDGQDTITDADTTPGNTDRIVFGADILPTEVNIQRLGDDLKLSLQNTADSITVKSWYQNESPTNRIERVEFADGTVWDVSAIQQAVIQGTPLDDVIKGYAADDGISGFAGNDSLFGLGGDDTIYGQVGNDTLAGGTGNDRLYGVEGNDTLTGGAGRHRQTTRARLRPERAGHPETTDAGAGVGEGKTEMKISQALSLGGHVEFQDYIEQLRG